MSNLTKAQRDALPVSSFGDPDRRLYPIVDASDVRGAAALLGKAPPNRREAIKRRIMAIAKRKGFMDAIPDAWMQDSKGMS